MIGMVKLKMKLRMKPKAKALKNRPTAKGMTITALVKSRLAKDEDIPAVDLMKAVKAVFPKSAFDIGHAAWYRSAFKNGRLK